MTHDKRDAKETLVWLKWGVMRTSLRIFLHPFIHTKTHLPFFFSLVLQHFFFLSSSVTVYAGLVVEEQNLNTNFHFLFLTKRAHVGGKKYV